MQKNVLVLRRYMMKYLGVKGYDVCKVLPDDLAIVIVMYREKGISQM